MEEKVLIKSKRQSWIGIFIISAVILFVLYYIFIYHFERPEYARNFYWLSDPIYGGIFFAILITVAILCHVIGHSELVITTKRAYGKAAFKKRVDLPIDSISSVGTCWFNGISIASSSGNISFLLIENRNEIHKCISELLVERQGKPAPTTTIKQEVSQSSADELKKFKELLDAGIITQDEFDAKKKQLLGI